MAKSIMQDKKECYFCHSQQNLECHHALHGTANRKLAEKYGLKVWLCRNCHADLHDKGKNDRKLQEQAQRDFENVYGHDDHSKFRGIFGKNYL